MQTIALNENNDIYLDISGNLALVRDIEAVEQVVSCEIRTNYGEIVLNTRLGIPYFETLFVAHPDIELWKSYVAETILRINKVLGIQYFKTYIDKAILKYVVVINTEYGEGELNG